jgi:hypothetical protein
VYLESKRNTREFQENIQVPRLQLRLLSRYTERLMERVPMLRPLQIWTRPIANEIAIQESNQCVLL